MLVILYVCLIRVVDMSKVPNNNDPTLRNTYKNYND